MQEMIRWSDSLWQCVDDYIRVQLSVWLQVMITIPARSNHATIRIFKLEMTTTKISSKPNPLKWNLRETVKCLFFSQWLTCQWRKTSPIKVTGKKRQWCQKIVVFLSPRLPLCIRVAKIIHRRQALLISAPIGRDRKTAEKGREISAQIRSFLHRQYLPQFRPTLQIHSTAVFLALFSGPDLQHKGFCIPCQMYPPLPCLPCEGDDGLYRTRHEQGRFWKKKKKAGNIQQRHQHFTVGRMWRAHYLEACSLVLKTGTASKHTRRTQCLSVVLLSYCNVTDLFSSLSVGITCKYPHSAPKWQHPLAK